MTDKNMQTIIDAIGKLILGKEQQIRLALAAIFAQGHLLIEDIPGVGKTTLAHVIAATLGMKFSRIQFTSDLLPADILGVSIFERETSTFEFHRGPIFSELVLADEVNRATPKTQSALLEAMEEHQISIEGVTHALPDPFFVIATQNPSYQIGTFPLPESQLDRFLMVISLGYPSSSFERDLLAGKDRREMLHDVKPILTSEKLKQIQKHVRKIHASDALINYVQLLLDFTRSHPQFRIGLSPRAGLALLQAGRAWAFIAGRDHVLPEDIQAVLPHVAAHRLQSATDEIQLNKEQLMELFQHVDIP